MFRDNTVFVVGAGASYEFDLPVGKELVERIQTRCACETNQFGHLVKIEDELLHALIQEHYSADDAIKALMALNILHNGIDTAVSIDAFIDRFQNNDRVATLGKLLIALEIAQAEQASILSPDRVAPAKRASDTWIGAFTRILFDGVYDPRRIGENVTIICFNYDRCIEQHLVEAISSGYGIQATKAEVIVAGMRIIHPYGTLGKLPWAGNTSSDVLPFGPFVDGRIDWFGIANKNIKTYTQQTHAVETTKAIHEAMAHCRVLVFLGFGFNNQNLDLLRIKGSPRASDTRQLPLVFATGKGLSEKVSATLKRRIGNLFSDYEKYSFNWLDRIYIEHDKTCVELFDIHNLNLSKFIEHLVDEAGGALVRLDGSGADG